MLLKKWGLLFVNIVLTFILFFIFSSEYNLLHYINAVFYLSFFYLVLFVFMYIAKGGFFDGVTFSFRRFNHTMFKKDDYLEEWKEKPLPSEMMNKTFYASLRFQVIVLVLFLLVLLVTFYNL
ncbi:DUF3899 domain-containing protein [Bacillus sp. B1-b2]|uniref:DUF3899 domain-containing protein n=1 Tax=Bacillus sp. B1-b2 TaxID=2653201 RepID=UPI0012616E93|nr:DUF3899 domain-containing protein [Bacillus sp. B1-b2]KAB7670722.1 DUF3899 domain-containing protein [Bacillus sp. B1-b2]